ncbi:hypothetical protein TNCV_2280331 [Trichonephila clavipes]|nr:hypothetical protein TNCV_2280331 [Trichonephila clavipes]
MNFSTSHLDSVSNSRHQCPTPSLHVPTPIQVSCSPPRTATSSGNINSYDMGWRLASRAICPATSSDGETQKQTTKKAAQGHKK